MKTTLMIGIGLTFLVSCSVTQPVAAVRQPAAKIVYTVPVIPTAVFVPGYRTYYKMPAPIYRNKWRSFKR